MSRICIATTVSMTLKSFVVPTAIALRDKGHEVTLVCSEDDEFAASLPEGINFNPIHMDRGVSFSGLQAITEFEKLFKRERFDLVQYSTPNASLYASIAAKRAKVPVRLYCQWGIRYVGMNGIARRLFKALEHYTCSNSTAIRSASPNNMEFAINEGLYSRKKAGVVGPGGTIGVDMAQFDITRKATWASRIRRELGIPNNAFVFGFSGRMCADKGCSELLEAFKAVSKKYDSVYLLAVGPAEDMAGIPKELADWAQKSDRVVMTGLVRNERMREFYSAMDVLVHPTYREGFGMVIQEAGALAVPVLTTSVLGASEVMVDGESCLLVEPRSSWELASAMNRLYLDADFLQKISWAAYEKTMKSYSREIMLREQLASYASLLSKNPGKEK